MAHSVIRKLWAVVVSRWATAAVLALCCDAAFAGPDTLVVCPAAFQPSLVEWKSYRESQGHEIKVVNSPITASEVRAAIQEANKSKTLKYVLLVGDAPRAGMASHQLAWMTTPTNYVRAKVNVQWGSEAWIASDIPFADLDSDGIPDLAIGRIPVASAQQLSVVLRKTLDYEQKTAHGAWERRLNIASGNGGFGAVTDAIIEAAARQVLSQTVPAEYTTQHIFPGMIEPQNAAIAISFAARAREQLSEGSLAWVYLGHGRPTELDRLPTATGSESILSVGDVPKLRCSGHSPLAVLVACYTGAMDAPRNCLAEELLTAEEGPVAVIAATRVTMPYGNTVLGCELLRACFREHPLQLGDSLRLAEQKTLQPTADDQLRSSLDSMAAGLSPAPADLAAERREHVLMYHLFGDPLLHLRRPVENSSPPTDVTQHN